jgi:hypothetical protein
MRRFSYQLPVNVKDAGILTGVVLPATRATGTLVEAGATPPGDRAGTAVPRRPSGDKQ